ncbi:MAG: DUF4271 domain-containing protein [Chitinophagales bacterium]
MLLLSISAQAKVEPAQYGILIFPDSATLRQGAIKMADHFLAEQPMMTGKYVISDIERPHVMISQTADFYLLLFLCLMLGLIRFMDTRYFLNLWRAFWNPTLSNRQLKEQLQGSGLPNFLMNIFFTFAGGAYIYYVVRFFTPHPFGVIPPSLLIIMLIAGTGLIYLAKYTAVRFSGWAFRVEGITEHYLFNVFLINKVLGIMLIPFIIILAFADHEWAQQAVIISFVISAILLLNRYFRSWQVFGSFFQYSKFHFILYLCASELLPLAVLMKLLVRGLMYY